MGALVAHTNFRRMFCMTGLLLLAFSQAAVAHRMLVVTSTLNATRKAAGVYVHSVDLSLGTVLPGATHVPGVSALAPLYVDADRNRAVLNSGSPALCPRRTGETDTSFASWFSVTPFALEKTQINASEPLWREWMPCTFSSLSQTWEVWLGCSTPKLSYEEVLGRVVLRGIAGGDEAAVDDVQGWTLPGAPVKALPVYAPVEGGGDSSDASLLVLCHAGRAQPSSLVRLDMQRKYKRVHHIGLPQEDDHIDMVPVDMVLSRDKKTLFVLASGFSTEHSTRETLSWLYAFDMATLNPLSAPLEIRGSSALEAHPLQTASAGRCWIATREPGTDFAYITVVHMGAQGIEKEAEHALTGVTHSLLLAPSPYNDDIAVSRDNEVSIWSQGERNSLYASFEQPFQCLQWGEAGLCAAEGGRLHVLDVVTAHSLRSIHFQSGWVTDFAFVPSFLWVAEDEDGDSLSEKEERKGGTDPNNPDSDGDLIHDGIDPEPRRFSPRLECPALVTFHEDALGYEVRVPYIQPSTGLFSGWTLTHDAAALPWLLLSSAIRNDHHITQMAVDYAQLDKETARGGVVQVRLPGAVYPRQAFGSPAEIQVRIEPGRGAIRRILWIRGDAQTSIHASGGETGLDSLATLLSHAPRYFAHHEDQGAFQESLYPYAVVVLDARAAAQGALTRQAVLDYVADGGALLFLGAHLGEDANPSFIRWLSPIGIRIDTRLNVNGRYAAAGDRDITRFWKSFPVHDGCAIYAEEDFALEPGGAKGVGAVFLARSYGLGRIALLSAATPLENPAMQSGEARRFAVALFHWLARAGVERNDPDNDGLPTEIEDRNANNMTESGETDFLNPDSDFDGISDGLEDVNRNGRVDDGETDPRNPDSDMDQIWDGADPSPCPVFGAPYIEALEPSEGYADAGNTLLITGRNLTAESTFWFDNQKAQWLSGDGSRSAVVQAPDALGDEEHWATLRVVSNKGVEGVLPKAYHYLPRRTIHFSFTHTPLQKGRGLLTLHLATEEQVELSEMVLFIRATNTPSCFQWDEPKLSPLFHAQGYLLQQFETRKKTVQILQIKNQWAEKTPQGALVYLPWQCEKVSSETPVHVDVSYAMVKNQTQGILKTNAEETTYTLQ